MPNLRKLFVHGTLIEVCARTEEGLPFTATPYWEFILHGIFARAQTLYPVSICHVMIMSNHCHLLIVVDDPNCVPGFVGHIKKESAHAVNRLLGRKKHTVWCDGYDAAVVLDAQKAIERIVYLYTNPAKANLIESIYEYPNVSTWKHFLSGGAEISCKRTPRAIIPKLPKKPLTLKEQYQLRLQLEEQAAEENILFIEPEAWLKCFPETVEANPDDIKAEIIKSVLGEEKQLAKDRTGRVFGREALQLEDPRQFYQPIKRGKRMICLSSIKRRRVAFIQWFKDYCKQYPRVCPSVPLSKWLAKIPPGMFAPGGFLRANILPSSIPLYA